ncbi:FAD dependent oxidoreductase [compost metagenome]
MTQIANGCYRLHPTEWNIGEAAGLLASYACTRRVLPRGVYESEAHLKAYQQLLTEHGVQLHWSEAELEMQ